MKKMNISKIWLVLVVMALVGCEKLPETNGNESVQDYYSEGSLIAFTLPTSAVINGYSVYAPYQVCENRDFSGSVINVDYTENLSEFRFINNLKPSTTYYYRAVYKDALGGEKYGETKEFTTQSADFQFLESLDASIVQKYWDAEDVREYELTVSVKPNNYFREVYNLVANLYAQNADGTTVDLGKFNIGAVEDKVDYTGNGFVFGKPSGTITYWITVAIGSYDNETVIYTSEKKTIVCPE
ncbi:MAG: hypothetical protein IJ633_03510 [Prevotella sp.]|nr:hypothetical protein [Prevotella sp.]